MCFSAPVSFLASGTLIALSVSSFRIAPSRELRILSLVPLIFGIQQAMEGFQWLALHAGHPNLVAAYIFLFFAFPFWLACVPIVVLLNEKQPKRITWGFVIAGIVASLFYLWALLFNTVDIAIAGNSIKYVFTTNQSIIPSVLYLTIICGSLLSFKEKSVRWFGVLIFLSAGITWLFYAVAFISVWCFFAAVLSSLIYLYIQSKRKEKPPVS